MKFTLNLQDFLKGLLIAVSTAVLVIIQASLAAGNLTFNWQNIGMAALAAALAYIAKNFLTDNVAVAKKVLTANAATPADAATVAEIQTKQP
jgi:membrane protein implicated in regulation of membrane protease activity